MSVYSRQRQIGDELQRGLSNQFVIATAPDHPLLMKGPDVLIGGVGSLTALLIPSATERRQPKLAVARFALCRMALPEPTKFILMASDGDDSVANELASAVAAVLPSNRPSERLKIAEVVAQPQRLDQSAVPESIRDKFKYKFGEIYRAAVLVKRRNSRSIIRVENDFPTPTSRNLKHLKRATYIAALTIKGGESSFIVDNGVPYSTEKMPEAAIVESLPDYPGDPQKYLRASAFSGWLLSETDHPYLVDLMYSLHRRISR